MLPARHDDDDDDDSYFCKLCFVLCVGINFYLFCLLNGVVSFIYSSTGDSN